MQGGSHVRPKRSLLGCAWCTSSNLNNSGDTSFDESQRAGMFLDDKVELAHRGIDGCCHSSPSAPPSKDQSGDRVDKLLAADLNSLSLQERDVVYEEIHGVASRLRKHLSWYKQASTNYTEKFPESNTNQRMIKLWQRIRITYRTRRFVLNF